MDLSIANNEIKENVFLRLKDLVNESSFIGGRYLQEFETKFAEFSGAKYCAGVANGTQAIRLALSAAGVGPGDEVITTTGTFMATVSPIIHCGATPILVDVDETTALIDIDEVAKRISTKTKAVIAVHLYGNVVDLDRLQSLCEKNEIHLIQDCAQAHGAKWMNKKLGHYGLAQTYSFYPGKNIGAWGDAGAVSANDRLVIDKVSALRNHGRSRGEKFRHDDIGDNCRMDAVQCLVLIEKLKTVELKNERRRRLYLEYVERLRGIGDLTFIEPSPKSEPVHHLFVIRTQHREELLAYLNRNNIKAGVHYLLPVHLQPAMDKFNYKKGDFPAVERLSQQILSLPFYAEMSEQTLDLVNNAVKSFFMEIV